ncbi:MAG: iron ABC transporter permease [Pseudomonadota bacterium]|nr:iron ABC transporter permease [Pseudomonadota bacterium]
MALTEVPVPELVLARRERAAGFTLPAPSPLRIAAVAAAGLVVVPLLAVVVLALQPAEAAVSLRLLARYAASTAALAVLVGLGSTALGAVAAWLVVMHRFPGRGLFEWALALPLAAPAYVLAYAYADLLDVAGPVQTWLRGAGLDPSFLQARSLPGAALILSAAFYPYVYLTARAAFLSQSVCALDAARTLGASAREAFWRVALPLARPALAAGAALAVMETLADYGAVTHLGVQTLTTGVVRAFTSYGSAEAAARLSLTLLGAAALLLWIERFGRRGETYGASTVRWRDLPQTPLRPLSAWGATAFCTTLLAGALLLPAVWLAVRAGEASPDLPRLLRAGSTSLGLGVAGAVLTVSLAIAIAFGAPRNRAWAAWPARLASLGYATPGAVMAIGLLGPAALLWRHGGAPAASAAAALGLLLYAYGARLTAAALEPIDAGLTRVTPSMDRAARMLGETEAGALRRVHAPLAKGALWTAALLVFVDVLKELPATLILRPFNFDTLAVQASNYAADERLAQAAPPALLLVALAVGPVILLSRRIARSRPGQG